MALTRRYALSGYLEDVRGEAVAALDEPYAPPGLTPASCAY